MVPPPSQAGKFKPRKPAKKAKAGSTTADSSAAERTTRAGGRRGKATSPATRGGRKRSPASIPRGAVYFTGNQPPENNSKKTTVSEAVAKTTVVPSSAKVKQEEEMVVGELDVAIGTSENPKKSRSPVADQKPQRTSSASKSKADVVRPSKTLLSILDTYDSDSSMEEQQPDGTTPSSPKTTPPTQLPFPVHSDLPMGVGEQNEYKAMYACQMSDATCETKRDLQSTAQQCDPPRVSPFCDASLQQQENDSWFLWQFPTRLPPLSSLNASGVVPDAAPSSSNVVDAMDPVTSNGPVPQATTSSIHAFDDSLSRAPSGPLGKILVYKSGKTVLVMGGRDGQPEVRMNVTEGLSCGFVQQAVAIDVDEGTYVPLGDVKKTVVVTPNVDQAFPST